MPAAMAAIAPFVEDRTPSSLDDLHRALSYVPDDHSMFNDCNGGTGAHQVSLPFLFLG